MFTLRRILPTTNNYFLKTCIFRGFASENNIVSFTAKTIREDGDIQYIDVDADCDKPLLDSLKKVTKIECIKCVKMYYVDHCGGKGTCGQCRIGLPRDLYSRLPQPSEEEIMTVNTNLSPPKFGRLACQLKPTPIFNGRTIEVFIPFE